MDFFMGARMHSTIAAFSSEVPVFPMAYSRKFNGLFADTLQYPYMADMKTQSNAEILANIKQCYGQRKRFKGNGASTYAYYSQGAQGNNGNKNYASFSG